MSKLGQLKKKVGYAEGTPICASCIEFRQQSVKLQDSLPVGVKAMHCNRHGFVVKRNACCDHWAGRQGEGLA